MSKIKSFTDLQQSRKLAEILSIESADMKILPFTEREYRIVPINDISVCGREDEICAWSLAALLGVLPEGTKLLKSTNISFVGDTKYHCDCPKGNIDEWFDNPIDACVAMILKLHELNLI